MKKSFILFYLLILTLCVLFDSTDSSARTSTVPLSYQNLRALFDSGAGWSGIEMPQLDQAEQFWDRCYAVDENNKEVDFFKSKLPFLVTYRVIVDRTWYGEYLFFDSKEFVMDDPAIYLKQITKKSRPNIIPLDIRQRLEDNATYFPYYINTRFSTSTEQYGATYNPGNGQYIANTYFRQNDNQVIFKFRVGTYYNQDLYTSYGLCIKK